MERKAKIYNPAEFIETKKHAKISRKTLLLGIHNIMLNSKCIIHQRVTIRGDEGEIAFGQSVILREKTTIKPSMTTRFQLTKLRIGDYVYIGENCLISPISIGSNVHIGKNCVVPDNCILKDNC